MNTWRRNTCPSRCRLILDITVICLWLGGLIALNCLVTPRHQGFFCDDTSIQYPYHSSTVSNDVILSVTIAAPVVILFLTETLVRLCRRKTRRSGREQPGLWEVAEAYLAYFWGYLVLTMLVVLLKLTTGQLRPHFLALCQPDIDLESCRGYISEYNCTNPEADDKLLNTARQSFPSGHAAYAVYMALFMIFYLDLRLPTRHCRLLKMTSYALLMSYALWCGATRVSDHMHHVTDVVAGGLLGLMLAVGTFKYAATPCLNKALSSNTSPNNSTTTNITSSANDISPTTSNANDTDEEEDDDNLKSIEAEGPSTPTPLLSGVSITSCKESRPKRPCTLVLEGNKHHFARKTRSSYY